MTKRITPAQQNEAYDHGYRSCEHAFSRPPKPYTNPYDSDKYWLLFMAYEQGWNDRASWEREQANPDSSLRRGKQVYNEKESE